MPADREEYTLLCVDDEASIRNALRRVFLDEDWAVFFAKDGEEGLRIFRENRVDLILSDFRMPGMDGVQFLKQAKEINPDCVRIVLSGYADIGLIVSALNEGEIYRFLPKPWNDDELLHNIRKALEHHRLGRENHRLGGELRALNAALEQKVLERTQELCDKNRRLRFAQVILELLPTPILGVKKDREVVFANAKARALFEDKESGLIGRPAPQVFEPELTGAIQRAMAEEKKGVADSSTHVLPMVFAGEAVGAIVLTPDEGLLALGLIDPSKACKWSVIPV